MVVWLECDLVATKVVDSVVVTVANLVVIMVVRSDDYEADAMVALMVVLWAGNWAHLMELLWDVLLVEMMVDWWDGGKDKRWGLRSELLLAASKAFVMVDLWVAVKAFVMAWLWVAELDTARDDLKVENWVVVMAEMKETLMAIWLAGM